MGTDVVLSFVAKKADVVRTRAVLWAAQPFQTQRAGALEARNRNGKNVAELFAIVKRSVSAFVTWKVCSACWNKSIDSVFVEAVWLATAGKTDHIILLRHCRGCSASFFFH